MKMKAAMLVGVCCCVSAGASNPAPERRLFCDAKQSSDEIHASSLSGKVWRRQATGRIS